ncbi:hypothetical protein FRC00_011017 [Tulasnella sp. 408]|nr:hypothetical protein FRC00_011017 [Tulasnella sp. 408]
MRLTISSLFVLATAAVATADGGSLNPSLDSIKPIPISSLADSVKPIVGRMTNAKRLALKLPPLKPKALRRVKNKDDDSVLGYLTRNINTFGEYGTFQPAQADSLEVTFYASPDDPSPEELDLHADNGPTATFPYVGAGYASDSDDFGTGSYNYAYVAGTQQSPAGSSAQVGDNTFSIATGIPGDWESAIWKYNRATQEITAQWINTDGSSPATYIIYANDGNDALIITGDADTLNETFGTTYPGVTLTCVAPVAQQPLRE